MADQSSGIPLYRGDSGDLFQKDQMEAGGLSERNLRNQQAEWRNMK